ncbi:uncharacterized protein HMPREF1541_03680 [Cyphellophora europaea CBS 101466]|uniref:DDHD domain-containing protein n=1 Tax=Cyphellophora europaea (strain CBS 101466) TaxID=1220924 RepID=W2S107_CYPE1|nr:uncharacterized protein HMPREF1541_03680 [Cyphellophora europaea CBS 101466]ETN41743.1 hypothetical protein HMPREF1541_03680 [Cyphellophora europaea CBS 101466]
MAEGEHSYGPTCAFHDDSDDPLSNEIDTPPVEAQFFYVSSLPIDDPLSPLPPAQAETASQQPPQPFSARDSAALEEAWQGLHYKKPIEDVRPSSRHMFSFPRFREGLRSPSPKSPSTELATSVLDLAPGGDVEVRKKHRPVGTRSQSSRHAVATLTSKEHIGHSSRSVDRQVSRRSSPETVRRPKPDQVTTTPGVARTDVMLSQNDNESGTETPVNEEELQRNDTADPVQTPSPTKRRHFSPFRRTSKDKPDHDGSPRPGTPGQSHPQEEHSASDISGRPFARAPSNRNMQSRLYEGLESEDDGPRSSRSRSRDKKKKLDKSAENEKVYVPVGVSRLHLVELPDLMMKPIYWSPINDTSTVVRATWFYKDTMLPVPANLANRLEIGYEYIKPYAESYQDELQACINNGASAEMKVVHKLWDDRNPSRPTSGADKLNTSTEETQAMALPAHSENAAADPTAVPSKRMFETHSVIYIDRKNAQVLRPSLLPSVAQKRRPLSALRKGRQIGVAVVRGFNRKAWLKIHPDPKMNEKAAHAKVGAYMSQSGDATTRGRRMSCAACDDRYSTPKVSDLVLVIHGIGQKLSERVDSFHFTHSINGLRRDFNVELSSEAVKGNMKSQSGIMVLPVNWRLTVSFDEGKEEAEDDDRTFALKNITPDTLPAVRSIISDVMLDIPYYMSHHKEKMTSAVIREANRVYRLWCRNNPGFREAGRVHIVAHSLGSVMAMEILSNQPTYVSADVDIESTKASEQAFEFNTTNLFCCGSPCGFFLLLNNARLIPRRGRAKPGMESEAHGPNITSESQYGCLAVDNVYNILNRTDPVSYLMNASVDADYAASLQPATIPSATLGWLSRMGSSLRWASHIVPDPYSAPNVPERPHVAHMPSTVELETHNFTREDVAEKRMYLLNENGQIDYHLASGGGPLEIQYLSMLSAHSSYWISRDFVRFLVIEIGRKEGRANTLPVLRAVKRREWKRGNLAE